MGNFSDELSSIMRIRKIAVDDIIQSMNISRAAFFKYKNGTRLPAKAEIVEEIADALRLNYNERNSLLESPAGKATAVDNKTAAFNNAHFFKTDRYLADNSLIAVFEYLI